MSRPQVAKAVRQVSYVAGIDFPTHQHRPRWRVPERGKIHSHSLCIVRPGTGGHKRAPLLLGVFTLAPSACDIGFPRWARAEEREINALDPLTAEPRQKHFSFGGRQQHRWKAIIWWKRKVHVFPFFFHGFDLPTEPNESNGYLHSGGSIHHFSRRISLEAIWHHCTSISSPTCTNSARRSRVDTVDCQFRLWGLGLFKLTALLKSTTL